MGFDELMLKKVPTPVLAGNLKEFSTLPPPGFKTIFCGIRKIPCFF